MKVYMLLDRSGSMQTRWSEAVQSVNSYVNALEKDTEVYLALFDDQGYDVVRDVKAGSWTDLKTWDYQPRGWTPLYDSFMKMAHKADADNQERTVLVVMTDGHENSSREFSKGHVQDKVKRFQSKEWPVVFLGASFQDALNVGHDLGINRGSTYVVNDAWLGANAMSLASRTNSYESVGLASTMDIDDDERKLFAS